MIPVNIAQDFSTPHRRSPEDILDELREAERNIRESRSFVRAAKVYSPEEMAFIGKMKGGLLPRERAIGQLKTMMQEDLALAFSQFIGKLNGPIMKTQIEFVTKQVQDTYNKVFEALGLTEMIQVHVTMNLDNAVLDVFATEKKPCPQTT